jgi:16S rRNA (guanine966-N2)-methyltransferase
MRIIGGSAAGLILKVPPGYDVRPTPDLVRQAIFNSFGERVVRARVLELFGGSGALSLECLSRGAAHATCVELSRRHARFIELNFVATGLPKSSFRLRQQDVFTALAQLVEENAAFDLILADPPFGEKNLGRRSTSLSQKLLDNEHLLNLVASEGLLVLGHTHRDRISIPKPWRQVKEMRHGDSMMEFLQLARNENNP